MGTTQNLLIISAIVVILIIIIIFNIKRKKKTNKQDKIIRSDKNTTISSHPDILRMTMSDDFQIMPPSDSLTNVFLQKFKPTLENHINKIIINEKDSILKKGLQFVLEKSDIIQKIVDLKTVQCLNDGKSHAGGFLSTTGIFINVTCCNCYLEEIKNKFESQFGPYKIILNQHIKNTEKMGGNQFVHIFYCFTADNCAITLCFIDFYTKISILPQELMQENSASSIKFIREEVEEKYTYHIYSGPSEAAAKTFLEENPVNQYFFYIIVKTPEGNFGRDIDGIYNE